MCAKYRVFALYPRVFLGCVWSPCIERERDGLRELSDRDQRKETKGFLLISTTEGTLHSFTNGRLLLTSAFAKIGPLPRATYRIRAYFH